MASEAAAITSVSEASAMTPVLYRVTRRRRETADTCTIELEPAGVDALDPFAPGQFSMLYAFGAGEVPISISGDTSRPGKLVHTIRDVGAVSSALGAGRRGDTIGVRGPFGTAWPVAECVGHDVLVIAGGIGLAPLRPAVYRFLAERGRYGEFAILYGGRSPAELLYPRELERWGGRFDVQVEVTVDTAPGGWNGRVGVVTTLISRANFNPDNAIALICGPEVMMRFTVAELRNAGVADERIYISMERNMKCAIGHCGHCQLGPTFICKEGPVYRWDAIESLLAVREL